MQPEIESLAIKQQRNFLIIDNNCEYLTVVRKSLNANSGKEFQLLSEYLKKLTDVRIDFEGFVQCLIQSTYLIYTAKYYGLNPSIEPSDVRVQEIMSWNDRRFSIVIYYRFSDQPRSPNTYSSIVKGIYKYLKDCFEQYDKKVKETSLDAEQRAFIKNFFQQVSVVEAKLGELDEDQQQKQFYMCLEETELFRDYCMLLKIKNATMLDYIKLKFHNFKLFKEKDVNLVNQYNNERKKIKCDIEELKKKEKSIEKNIIQFFQGVEKTNKSKFKLKLEPDQNYKTKFIFTVYETTSQPFLQRLEKAISSQRDMVMQAESQGQQPKQKVPYTEYQIEYNSERNSICVRLIMSSVVCSTESTDFILFQSNVLTFESANISLEFVEDKSMEKNQQSKKSLAFRGASCFNNKEPILEKVLVLMDLTMIAAKICEPELLTMRKNFMVEKDPQKISIIYSRMLHYTKIFLRCSKKVYSQ